ncbi:hypothetical protein HZC00_01880 [Candidatus Kaiserbacteria bacterium]|nr:hypothetical protein [Candidatus Kaiserbacteria bacterium]
MIGKIIAALVATAIFLMIIFWVISGGPAKVISAAKSQPDIISSLLNGSLIPKLFSIKLPWQDSVSIPGAADISQYTSDNSGGVGGTGYSQEQIDQARNFGMPSPYRSQVTLQEGRATENNPSKEYVAVTASRDNEGAVDITGWSVQSAVSGERYYLPPAASAFIGGAVNSTGSVTLEPGATAIITSGVSPVGVSFHENICSGYLGKLQAFYPSLDFSVCPDPSKVFPETPENLRTYGSSCLDYVRNLSSCEFPQDLPTSLSPACRSYVTNTFSYNGCVHLHQNESSFLHNSWRLFINAQRSIWDDRHDIIRLLDAKGRTVDAVTY